MLGDRFFKLKHSSASSGRRPVRRFTDLHLRFKPYTSRPRRDPSRSAGTSERQIRGRHPEILFQTGGSYPDNHSAQTLVRLEQSWAQNLGEEGSEQDQSTKESQHPSPSMTQDTIAAPQAVSKDWAAETTYDEIQNPYSREADVGRLDWDDLFAGDEADAVSRNFWSCPESVSDDWVTWLACQNPLPSDEIFNEANPWVCAEDPKEIGDLDCPGSPQNGHATNKGQQRHQLIENIVHLDQAEDVITVPHRDI